MRETVETKTCMLEEATVRVQRDGSVVKNSQEYPIPRGSRQGSSSADAVTICDSAAGHYGIQGVGGRTPAGILHIYYTIMMMVCQGTKAILLNTWFRV